MLDSFGRMANEFSAPNSRFRRRRITQNYIFGADRRVRFAWLSQKIQTEVVGSWLLPGSRSSSIAWRFWASWPHPPIWVCDVFWSAVPTRPRRLPGVWRSARSLLRLQTAFVSVPGIWEMARRLETGFWRSNAGQLI